jgi:apolipoprotein N-acyltransferase
MLKVLRRGSTRYLALSAILLTILLCLYYANYTGTQTGNPTVVTVPASAPDALKLSAQQRKEEEAGDQVLLRTWADFPDADLLEPEPDTVITPDTCPAVPSSKTDVDTVEQFKKFEFQVRPPPDRLSNQLSFHAQSRGYLIAPGHLCASPDGVSMALLPVLTT